MDSSPLITNNLFSFNSSANGGGAIYIDSTSVPAFSSNTFLSNSASIAGGAIYSEDTNLIISNDIFKYNSSVSSGGAIYIDSNTTLSIDTGYFLGNYSDFGGAIRTDGTLDVSILNTYALGNEANKSDISNGGFIYLGNDTNNSVFVKSIFSGNKSLERNGVLRPNRTSRFVNCTFAGNEATTYGGVTLLFNNDDYIELDNCVIWNNSANSASDIYVYEGSASLVILSSIRVNQ